MMGPTARDKMSPLSGIIIVLWCVVFATLANEFVTCIQRIVASKTSKAGHTRLTYARQRRVTLD